MKHIHLLCRRERKAGLSDFDPGFTGKFRQKEEAREKLAADIDQLAKYQGRSLRAGHEGAIGDLSGAGRCGQRQCDQARNVRC
jgi:hypothetical protein